MAFHKGPYATRLGRRGPAAQQATPAPVAASGMGTRGRLREQREFASGANRLSTVGFSPNLDQRVNSMEFRVEGPAGVIAEVRKVLVGDSEFEVQPPDDLENLIPPPMGMDAIAYLAVVFVGHLGASLAHDGIVKLLRGKLASKVAAADKLSIKEDGKE